MNELVKINQITAKALPVPTLPANYLSVVLHFEDGLTEHKDIYLPCDIGRLAGCGLRLRSWRVAKKHTRLVVRESGVFVEDLGTLSGTLVNGMRSSRYGPLKIGDEVIVGHCKLVIQSIQLERNEHAFTAMSVQETQEEYAVKPERNDELVCPDQQLKIKQIQKHLHKALLERLDLRRRDIHEWHDASLREEAKIILEDLIAQETQVHSLMKQEELVDLVLNEAIGLGPLESLLKDPTITEIMVNRFDEIYVERAGLIQPHPTSFSDEHAVRSVIDRIVAPIGRRIDESSPMVDGRLPDGSRVNAVIPPISLKGSNLTIRKFPQKRPTIHDLLQLQTLDSSMSEFLSFCVKQKKNLIISGGTGSGKTTLLNILSSFIPENERIITIEDAAELRLNHKHLIALEARPENSEGRGLVTIRDLVRNALRMRPDRIVVGECRGVEALDMLVAMNTGHEGSLTTLHANSPRDALSRLETMILMAGMDLPLGAIREQIASSIDFIVQQARLSNGQRVITHIVEVCGLESGVIKTQDIFRYEQTPEGGKFLGMALMPECFSKLSHSVQQSIHQWFCQSSSTNYFN